jgi:hypothetical protein
MSPATMMRMERSVAGVVTPVVVLNGGGCELVVSAGVGKVVVGTVVVGEVVVPDVLVDDPLIVVVGSVAIVEATVGSVSCVSASAACNEIENEQIAIAKKETIARRGRRLSAAHLIWRKTGFIVARLQSIAPVNSSTVS